MSQREAACPLTGALVLSPRRCLRSIVRYASGNWAVQGRITHEDRKGFRVGVAEPAEDVMGDPPGPRGPPYTACPAVRECHPSRTGNKEADNKERRLLTPSHLHFTAHRGACGKPQVVSYNRHPRPENDGHRRSSMLLLLGTDGSHESHGSRRAVEPLVGLAAPLRALVAEGSDALVATGVMPDGVWL